jgi:hypothetical protein
MYHGGDANLDADQHRRLRPHRMISPGSPMEQRRFQLRWMFNVDDFSTVIDANTGNQNGFIFPDRR